MGLSAASVGRVVQSGRGIDLPHWSMSSRVVCACWGSGFRWDPKHDFLFLGASSCLFVLQVPPPGFGMCPGLVPSGGSIPPPGFGFGCCAVMATAMFQIFQGTKQKEFGLSGARRHSPG